MELNAQNAEFWLALGNKTEDKPKAKQFFGKVCDKGNQEGCDKYRKLNEKGVE